MQTTCLTDPTLVLNKNWLPIQVCPVRRAFTLLFKGLARVVEPQDYSLYDFDRWSDLAIPRGDPFVQGVRSRIRIPEVIVLQGCDRFNRPRVAFTRRNLFRRDRNCCQYCGKKCSTEDLSIDHVIPRCAGGEGSWTNCVVACLACNARKGGRLVGEAGMHLLREPVEPPAQSAFTLHVNRRKASWEHFVSEAYWNTELKP
jgi:5-methylcytosine-specific restriction endonuclease McrA